MLELAVMLTIISSPTLYVPEGTVTALIAGGVLSNVTEVLFDTEVTVLLTFPALSVTDMEKGISPSELDIVNVRDAVQLLGPPVIVAAAPPMDTVCEATASLKL